MRKVSSIESLEANNSLRARFLLELAAAMKGKTERDNYIIDRLYGQAWNLGGFSPAELNYLIRYFLPATDKETIAPQNVLHINDLYGEIVILNSELRGLPVLDAQKQSDVLRGIASGLHFNDVRYFVADLNGSGVNMSPYDRALSDKAQALYYGQFGDRTQVKQIDGVATFILSNETARRIIENRPYEKIKKK